MKYVHLWLKEDLDWFSETHYKLPPGIKSVILFGQEDWPTHATLYKCPEPLYEDHPEVVVVSDDAGVLRSVEFDPKPFRYRYKIPAGLSLAGIADPHRAELTVRESASKDGRVIGGDRGDISFRGYRCLPEHNRTDLDDPVFLTSDVLTPQEAYAEALCVLAAAFRSVGLECLQ